MRVAGIESGALYALGVVVLIAGALVIAWVMWRVVEEPAREWMRGLVGTRPTPTEEAGEEIVEETMDGDDKGAPIDPVAVPDEDEP
jgi:peptidoglycan/LPS O-acetylase OafA/YrhL